MMSRAYAKRREQADDRVVELVDAGAHIGHRATLYKFDHGSALAARAMQASPPIADDEPTPIRTVTPFGRGAAMQFLVELTLSPGSRPATLAEGREFIEGYILPTLERCQALAEEKKILAGGPQSGAVALVLIVEAASAGELDELVTSLPVWPRMDTKVTPLSTFEDRRRSIFALRETLKRRADERQGMSVSQ